MRAITVAAYGDAGHLRLEERPPPEPAPGEALLRQTLAGVNFIDVYMRAGLYRSSRTYAQRPPFVLGMEGCGVIERLNDVDPALGLKPGTRVAYCLQLGSYAGQAAVPAWKLVPIPDEVPDEIATTLMLQGSTAHYLTHSLFALQPGQRCLIHAGAGGVGQLAVQLAKACGAEVFTTVGSPEKAELARRRGADHAILYRSEDFAQRVAELTGGEGVDVVYDSVGQATIAGSLKCLKRRGTLVNFGAASGAVEAVSPLALAEAGSVFFTRPHLADYMATAAERRARALDLFAHYVGGRLEVAIDRRLPLAEARQAHELLEGRATTGKLLLDCGD